MTLSAFDLYSIGIGPSSSHTVGPMRAAKRFVAAGPIGAELAGITRVRVELFGSLGATGRGHGSEAAVLLGLEGADPATVDPALTATRLAQARADQVLRLNGTHTIVFDPEHDLILDGRTVLPGHPNGMRFTAYDDTGAPTASETYYSVGGGFVLTEAELAAGVVPDTIAVPWPFTTGAELLRICADEDLTVTDVMMANELALGAGGRSESEIRAGLLKIWQVMSACIDAGCGRDLSTDGVLPGGLQVPRRAPALFTQLASVTRGTDPDPLHVIDWVNLFALAVNEENASGGQVVTAPTNGAAGIIPAVLRYYVDFVAPAGAATAREVDDAVVDFLLTAAAIGILVKLNASISGAEVGCQGEVGSACAMAAGALCALLGGSPAQVENAAEVGIEHNLGLTCDPIGGLVQIPCIERNAIGAVKAINAARLARNGSGAHLISLDRAIATMRETGKDMHDKYKETSLGGLAVSVVEC